MARKSLSKSSQFDPFKKGWHEIHTKKDLPHTNEIVLFERKDGFRFYGHARVDRSIKAEGFKYMCDWWMVSKWCDDGTHTGERQWADD